MLNMYNKGDYVICKKDFIIAKEGRPYTFRKGEKFEIKGDDHGDYIERLGIRFYLSLYRPEFKNRFEVVDKELDEILEAIKEFMRGEE